MTIHIFNPEHDLALASGLRRFTAPHAGRQLRSDLSFLPAVWAREGDVVLVDDMDAAEAAWRRVRFIDRPKVEFATFTQLPTILSDEGIIAESSSSPDVTAEEQKGRGVSFDPWGWDAAIRYQFILAGVPKSLLPTEVDIANIRNLSSRIHTTDILSQIRTGLEYQTCGESLYCDSEQAVAEAIACFDDVVVKAPWSSSGRGVRYLPQNTEGRLAENTWNWIRNTISQQGGVMVEPYYSKVKDFAMEFCSQADGTVKYCGLSLFQTHNGAYTGNILTSEEHKREIQSQYISLDLLDTIIHRLEQQLSSLIAGRYIGPLGVDMMIVTTPEADRFLLHPCVEINLRRTMGHVSLSLYDRLTITEGTMQVAYEQKQYSLKVK